MKKIDDLKLATLESNHSKGEIAVWFEFSDYLSIKVVEGGFFSTAIYGSYSLVPHSYHLYVVVGFRESKGDEKLPHGFQTVGYQLRIEQCLAALFPMVWFLGFIG
jgi:hypothetical protein